MNTPPPVTSTIFKDVIKSTVAAATITSANPVVNTPSPGIPTSPTVIPTPKIKSSHILIGIGLIVGTLVIFYLINKNRNKTNRGSYH